MEIIGYLKPMKVKVADAFNTILWKSEITYSTENVFEPIRVLVELTCQKCDDRTISVVRSIKHVKELKQFYEYLKKIFIVLKEHKLKYHLHNYKH
jgi:hypothetical protein